MSYWRVYIVLIKPPSQKIFRPLLHGCGDGEPRDEYVVTYQTRRVAREVCREQQQFYGRRNAYVQKCGAIS